MVYLIHFHRPLGHAKHYLGYCKDNRIFTRLKMHANGTGAHLLRILNELGVAWYPVRLWHNADQRFERRLKRTGKSRLCPVCNPTTYHKREAHNNGGNIESETPEGSNGLVWEVYPIPRN